MQKMINQPIYIDIGICNISIDPQNCVLVGSINCNNITTNIQLKYTYTRLLIKHVNTS